MERKNEAADQQPDGPRETRCSFLRMQQSHGKGNPPPAEEDYRTPMQRKDDTLKELKNGIKQLSQRLNTAKLEIAEVENRRMCSVAEIKSEKGVLIKELEKQVEAEKERMQLEEAENAQLIEKITLLRKETQDLQDGMDAQEVAEQEIYLQMYKKGQRAILFERQQELERFVRETPDSVSVKELVEKLTQTEADLDRWQKLRRAEVYAQYGTPESQQQATLRFFKDSMYHYLTDPKNAEQHLKAMIGLLDYSEVQMKKISEKKGKSH